MVFGLEEEKPIERCPMHCNNSVVQDPGLDNHTQMERETVRTTDIHRRRESDSQNDGESDRHTQTERATVRTTERELQTWVGCC